MKPRKKSASERKKLEDRLYRAVLELETVDECRKFFIDLCTPVEIEAMSDRWGIVGLLLKNLSYREIAAETGVSVATIGRVARCLHGDIEGYRLVAKKIGEWKND